MDVHRLIAEHGAWFYLLTFAWTFIEGETFVLAAAGFAATTEGALSALLLLLAAWLGSFSGDQCYFWVGRHFGLRLLSGRPSWRVRVDSALAWMKRYDTWFILSFRFIYGVRNIASFALGISGVAWQRFLVLNFIAALLWAGTFVSVGYFCGRAVERLIGESADRFEMLPLGIFALLLLIGVAVHKLRRWRRRARAEAAQTASPSP